MRRLEDDACPRRDAITYGLLVLLALLPGAIVASTVLMLLLGPF